MPQKAEEIRYIVLISNESLFVGNYSDGAGGYKPIVHLVIKDLRTSQTKELSFIGSEPPQIKNHSGNAFGAGPDINEIKTSVAATMNEMDNEAAKDD